MTKREKERKRPTQKDTMKPSAPRKRLQRQNGWNKSRHGGTNKVMKAPRILKKMTHFFHLQKECLLIKATRNTMLRRKSFFSFVLPAIVLEIIWHINHVDISFFPPSNTTAVCFQEGTQFVFFFLRGSLEKSFDAKERRKETGTFHQSCPPLEDKANMH